ncbi:acyl carrier protein [Paracraurococcus ruber]|uniref:Acyl carrier protein n=1 Tax=Paracraurococcus ruber TaxID=77675 RepID=A0ABS1D1U1_9PROT|nr:acyl carrier protein [Paracraurococcus ruber]MBK1660456.1 hypothetical protein [Paracraurococcus ruber]
MTAAAIAAGLAEVFRSVFGDPGLRPDPAWTPADLDGWDSLRHVALILATEARFGIRLPAAAPLGSVGDLQAAVAAALRAATGGDAPRQG